MCNMIFNIDHTHHHFPERRKAFLLAGLPSDDDVLHELSFTLWSIKPLLKDEISVYQGNLYT